jgi:hypothetical protein
LFSFTCSASHMLPGHWKQCIPSQRCPSCCWRKCLPEIGNICCFSPPMFSWPLYLWPLPTCYSHLCCIAHTLGRLLTTVKLPWLNWSCSFSSTA